MQLRKEQVVFIGTLAILGLMLALGNSGRKKRGLSNPRDRAKPSLSLPGEVAIDDPISERPRDARDLFLKPSDTKPLPPLELALPPLEDLPILPPPIFPGPDVSHWYLQRVQAHALLAAKVGDSAGKDDGASKESDSASPGDPASKDESTGGNSLVTPTGSSTQDAQPADDIEKDYSDTLDKLVMTSGKPKWGYVLGEDRFRHGRPDVESIWILKAPFNAPVQFKQIDPETGRHVMTIPVAAGEIVSLEFAHGIKNRIGLFRRRTPMDDTSLKDRERFLRELLRQELGQQEAMEEAEAQAKIYQKLAPKDPRGFELLAAVYAMTGQLEKELEFYDGLANGPFKEAAFVLTGRGRIADQLGLEDRAIQWLREAVAKDPSYAKGWLQLSASLLKRFRGAEARVAADRAARLIAPGMDAELALRIRVQQLRAQLAVGAFQEASGTLLEARGMLGPRNAFLSSELDEMGASILFGKGDFTGALSKFHELATAKEYAAMPLIGAGVSAMRAGDPTGAMTDLEAAALRDPLQRHWALAGQAFLLLLDQKLPAALAKLQEAYEMAPDDPYVLYLHGRALRLSGDPETAVSMLEKALARHSDFLEAMAERALALLQLAEREVQNDPERALGLLGEAQRYASRVVRVDAKKGKSRIYQDLLGTIRYRMLDNEGAKEAFRSSIDWGGNSYAKILLALIAYRQGYTDRAITDLVTLTQEIRTKEDPFRAYAERSKDAIIDHRGKRVFLENFDRGIGEKWKEISRQKLHFSEVDGRARIAGKSEGPDRDLFLRYTLDEAMDFLEVSVDLHRLDGFTGSKILLRISDNEGGTRQSKPRFLVEAGYNAIGRGAYVYFQQGQNPSAKDKFELTASDDPRLKAVDFSGQKPVRLTITRVVANQAAAKTSGTREEIIIRIGGVEVLRQKLRSSSIFRKRPLFFDFFVAGQQTTQLNAAFDNFRLVRYGE